MYLETGKGEMYINAANNNNISPAKGPHPIITYG